MEKERLSWLDVLKGIGIILVVMGHIYSNSIIFNWLYSFHMPLFFFAAGCVYKNRSVYIDIKRRIQTIVVPYFSFGFINLIYWYFIEKRFRNSSMGLRENIFGLLFGQYDYLDFNVHLWFLPCFFTTVVLFNFLYNKLGEKITYIIVILMSILYIFIPIPKLFWGIDLSFKYMAFYAVGVSSQKILKKNNVNNRNNKASQSIIAIILLIINFCLSYWGLTTGIMWFITAQIGVIGVTISSLIINKNKLLEYLGKISLIILCMHGPIYRIVIKITSVILNINSDIIRTNLFYAVFIVLVTILICSAVYNIVIRTVPWMVGKKNNM